MSFNEIELEVVRWGEARGIVQNGTPRGQANKTLEEVEELRGAIFQNNHDAIRDAVGDIMATLVMVCATMERETGKVFTLLDCFNRAYQEIKDRKGYLTPEGVFVKEAA